MWIEPSDKSLLEEQLFSFLLSVRNGKPQATKPMIADHSTLQSLCTEPHPDLKEALRHCLDTFLVELSSDPAQWGELQIPASAFGFALAFHNSLSQTAAAQINREEKKINPVKEFTSALFATLSPAYEKDTALVYHALLQGISAILSRLKIAQSEWLHELVEFSPLTMLQTLDVHTPIGLYALASELLPGWKGIELPQRKAWHSLAEWVNVVVMLLDDPKIARWLRHCWIAMPETRQSSRNIGLVIEALRRKGNHQGFIWEFYEAYDYLSAKMQPDEWSGQKRVWPLLQTIEKLLRISGDDEMTLKINRQGNEFFLKFRPLVEMIIAANGIPSEYKLLSRGFVQTLRPLLNYVTERGHQRITFREVAFEQQPK